MLKTEVELECIKYSSVFEIFQIGPFRGPICTNKGLRAGPNFKIMHFKMESCDLLTIALQMRYHKCTF